MKLIFSHPTGNANVRAAATAFAHAKMLAEFHTTVASFPGSLLERLGAIGPFSEIRRRRFDPILKPMTKTFPFREIARLSAVKGGLHKLIEHETGIFCIDSVYRSLDRQVASKLRYASKRGVNAVYAYDDGAAFSFQAAKRLGLQCFYDLPTGYWRAAKRLLSVERERWPDWIPTLTGFKDSEEKLARKDSELRMADLIFVASSFTANTLQEYPGNLAPITLIPYGFPPVGIARDYSSLCNNRRLKLLFVGKLTQQKGVANLFAAIEPLKDYVDLTIIGNKACNDCPALNTALAKHKWIPSLHHEGVIQLMREHDVLVFPSLFDGFGLVITEAMSQGTPVIATERCAGPDLINHGQNGWLVKAASTHSLQTAIEHLIGRPETIAEAGSQAMETARSRPWEVYGRELSAAINKHLRNFL